MLKAQVHTIIIVVIIIILFLQIIIILLNPPDLFGCQHGLTKATLDHVGDCPTQEIIIYLCLRSLNHLNRPQC